MSANDRKQYQRVKSDPVLYAAYLERKRIERKKRQVDYGYERKRKQNWRARNRERNTLMAAAHWAVEKAIERGELLKPAICSRCGGGGKIEGHHSSYAPEDRLRVEWLCVMCHHAQHRKTPLTRIHGNKSQMYPNQKTSAERDSNGKTDSA